MNELNNRYEFMAYISCVDANPNGDPDAGNMPRVDSDTMIGLISDGAIKRRIRDYVAMYHDGEPGMDLFVQAGVDLNRKTAQAKELAGVPMDAKGNPEIDKARKKACEMFWDVRTFGAVMSTGPNAGQVRGPVQIPFARSLDPIQQTDIGVTRVAAAGAVKDAKSAAEYLELESKIDADKLRTMGRKQFAPYGLYEVHGFVSPRLAQQTGFDEDDLMALFEAIGNMYDVTRTASKGMMSVVSPVIIFRHVGDPSAPEEEQKNQALLGRAPAYKLFELAHVQKKDGVEVPRSHHDYDAKINIAGRPAGIDIGFMMPFSGRSISWNALPEESDWLKES